MKHDSQDELDKSKKPRQPYKHHQLDARSTDFPVNRSRSLRSGKKRPELESEESTEQSRLAFERTYISNLSSKSGAVQHSPIRQSNPIQIKKETQPSTSGIPKMSTQTIINTNPPDKDERANQLDPNGRVMQNQDPPPALDATRTREGRNENSNMQTDETSELEKWKAIMIVMEKKLENLENKLRNGVKKELDLSNQVDQNQNETGQGQRNTGTKGSNPNQRPIIFKKEDNRSRNDYDSNDSSDDDDNDDDRNDDHFSEGQKKKYIDKKKKIEKRENESVVSRNNWIQDPALRLDSFIKINLVVKDRRMWWPGWQNLKIIL